MNTIAVLGLGAMGSRMARHLIKAGHNVIVYNRTPEKAAALEAEGATRASTPRDAAARAEVVIAMTTDDQASRAIWTDPSTGALQALQPNAIAIESSTLTPAWVRDLAAQVSSRGARFLDAPVVGSRPQAEAGQLIYLVGGEAATLEEVKPILSMSCSAVHHVGPIGHGSAMKLAVNALFGIQVAAISELVGMLKKTGVDEARASAIFGELPVTSPAVKGALASIGARNFAPMFPIDLVEKDFRYLLETAQTSSSSVPTANAVHQIFANARDAGHGEQNITGVAQLYLES
jgi:3-hydroxyisobutyrate dehydrogenase